MTSFDLSVPEFATGGVVTIGNFDGVHRGHQSMLSVVREFAQRVQRPAVVVTFDPHPVTVLKPDVVLPRLSSIQTRTRLLKQYGADAVVVLPVSSVLLNMTPQQFFHQVIEQRLQAFGLVEGPDFCFGRDRAGNTTVLRQLCETSNLQLKIIEPVCQGEHMISSTQIRQLLSQGNITPANTLLGHPYTVSGVVKPGAKRGRELGFPTANLEQIEEMLPADGVYAAACQIADQTYPVALSVGPNPTFGDAVRKVECHLAGFSGDLYNSRLNIQLLQHIRGLQSFASVEQLTSQIQSDVAASVRICNSESH